MSEKILFLLMLILIGLTITTASAVDLNDTKAITSNNLTDNYSGMTAMIFGEVYRHNGEWKFNAIGQGTTDPGLGELVNRFV